jgi:hypothetical protein
MIFAKSFVIIHGVELRTHAFEHIKVKKYLFDEIILDVIYRL